MSTQNSIHNDSLFLPTDPGNLNIPALSSLPPTGPSKSKTTGIMSPQPSMKQEIEIFGKPNLLMSNTGIQFGKFVNSSLDEMSMQEVIEIADKYGKRLFLRQTTVRVLTLLRGLFFGLFKLKCTGYRCDES